MLITARSLRELKFGELMAVYEEGNRENGAELWPGLPENQQILLAENEFYQFLREVFFTQPGAVYYILEREGKYVSALRLEPYRDGMLLEAVETAPCQRRKGYGEALLRQVLTVWSGGKIYSHVSKKNGPSLGLHKKCGFQTIRDYAAYVDGSVNDRCFTMLCEGNR